MIYLPDCRPRSFRRPHHRRRVLQPWRARRAEPHRIPAAAASAWRANAGRVVFIGATNGGTSMVEPANWREFIDLYTNLAMASTRAIGLIWRSLPIAEIARGVIDGVGAFVKYLVAYSMDGGGVPGWPR